MLPGQQPYFYAASMVAAILFPSTCFSQSLPWTSRAIIMARPVSPVTLMAVAGASVMVDQYHDGNETVGTEYRYDEDFCHISSRRDAAHDDGSDDRHHNGHDQIPGCGIVDTESRAQKGNLQDLDDAGPVFVEVGPQELTDQLHHPGSRSVHGAG